MLNLAHYQNDRIDSAKCTAWVVQTCASQIKDGRQPPSWKNRKVAISQQRFDRSPQNLYSDAF